MTGRSRETVNKAKVGWLLVSLANELFQDFWETGEKRKPGETGPMVSVISGYLSPALRKVENVLGRWKSEDVNRVDEEDKVALWRTILGSGREVEHHLEAMAQAIADLMLEAGRYPHYKEGRLLFVTESELGPEPEQVQD